MYFVGHFKLKTECNPNYYFSGLIKYLFYKFRNVDVFKSTTEMVTDMTAIIRTSYERIPYFTAISRTYNVQRLCNSVQCTRTNLD